MTKEQKSRISDISGNIFIFILFSSCMTIPVISYFLPMPYSVIALGLLAFVSIASLIISMIFHEEQNPNEVTFVHKYTGEKIVVQARNRQLD